MARYDLGKVVGPEGPKGEDALINGKKSISIEAGENISIEDTADGIKISSTGGGEGGAVDDVLVNGQSVLEDRIANINVPIKISQLEDDENLQQQISDVNGLAEQNERNITNLGNRVDHKQDELIAGENITIVNNVISATGGEVGTNQVFRGKNEPEDMNILLWIDTSDEEPIESIQLVTNDNLTFITNDNLKFILKEEN